MMTRNPKKPIAMSKTKTTLELGTLTITGTAVVADPCYRFDGTWTAAVIKDLKPGKYHAYVTIVDEGPMWGKRASELWIARESNKRNRAHEYTGIHLPVDSGSMGIYSEDYYMKYHLFPEGTYVNDEENPVEHAWYDRQFDERYNNKLEAKVLDDSCAISFSGYGDGTYPLYEGRNSHGELVALRVRFI